MKIGAWFHAGDETPWEEQIDAAAQQGITAARSYDIGYSEHILPYLKRNGMTLMAGIDVDGEALLKDWRSQVRIEELARYHELGVTLDAICVGNELREGEFSSTGKKFSARLSFGLANVLDTYRKWLDDRGLSTPLTYASEGIIFDGEGVLHEWMWPLIDACGLVSINLYPMDYDAWFTFGAFDESRRLLQDTRERHLRFALFELRLRRILDQLSKVNKPLCLTETGFPSATGHHAEEGLPVVPETDGPAYGVAMHEFMDVLRRVNRDCAGQIQSIYFYEWRDNLHHGAMDWQSPIHSAFGLCDRFGAPKFDIRSLIREVE